MRQEAGGWRPKAKKKNDPQITKLRKFFNTETTEDAEKKKRS
jgi:hypothetical protein